MKSVQMVGDLVLSIYYKEQRAKAKDSSRVTHVVNGNIFNSLSFFFSLNNSTMESLMAGN